VTVLFAFPGNEALAQSLVQKSDVMLGAMALHRFPDGEALIRIDSAVEGRDVLALCALDRPDEKAMALMFFAETARAFGARSLRLFAPYLGYMRQDARFRPGEALTSNLFAAFLSRHFDSIATLDPHLHRHKTMGAIYTIPAVVVHAADSLAHWVGAHVRKPLLIGPDAESRQWVADVAARIDAPYAVLSKTRTGDRNVAISFPEASQYKDRTPVLLDDIISTAQTMIAAVRALRQEGMAPPVCVGIHALFADNAWAELQASGPSRIATCNSVAHPSNEIDISAAFLSLLNA